VVAVCEGCAGGGVDLTSVLDFTIIVVKSWGVNNWQPPYAYYGDEDTLNDRNTPPPTLTAITPMATFDMPAYPKIEIQCGRTAFRIKGGTAWDQEHLRIAFIDDFRAKKATCGQVPKHALVGTRGLARILQGCACARLTRCLSPGQLSEHPFHHAGGGPAQGHQDHQHGARGKLAGRGGGLYRLDLAAPV